MGEWKNIDPKMQKVEKKESQKLGWRIISGSGNSQGMWKENKIPNWGKEKMMDPEKQKVEKKVSQKLGWRVISGSGNSHRMWKEIKNS